ncbi:SpoIID/LytB domain-containing protein [Faecalibacterium sp. 7]|uniref:SpoIID/LytB domain-containing protein n=1 Tax=Faecalibacterium sp. 7 TaxID=3402017 RepID=UPI003C2F5A30
MQLSRREYVLGAVAAEMPVSWPDEALKAQAVAAHTYALYCRDHAALQSGAWLTVDPARRQGCLTEPVLRSYWGTAYEQNYARLSALVDEVLNDLLFYDNAPACTSYFAISNGRTEASENVWGTALPYLIPVDSGTDLSADNYQYTAVFSAAQVQQAFSDLGITADLAAPESWFGPIEQTSSGYTKSLTVCGQTVSGTALRQALGLRSTCFTVQYQSGNFSFTTRGYGHGVGLSQWGAKAMAEQDADYADILAHYYPGTQLHRMGVVT